MSGHVFRYQFVAIFLIFLLLVGLILSYLHIGCILTSGEVCCVKEREVENINQKVSRPMLCLISNEQNFARGLAYLSLRWPWVFFAHRTLVLYGSEKKKKHHQTTN